MGYSGSSTLLCYEEETPTPWKPLLNTVCVWGRLLGVVCTTETNPILMRHLS